MEWLRSITQKILAITHGRSTAFFVGFFIAGHAMALAGKLTTTYVAYMSTLGALILGHSIKDGFEETRNGPRPPRGPDAP